MGIKHPGRHSRSYRRCGVPLALYSDRHAVFKYVPGSHQSPAPTQFGRAMAELGVEQIFARSPEAKGRVERANGTFQDRLVTELRLAGARTISEANQVLWAFLTRFNKRFGVPPAQSTNAYRSPDPDLNLAGILCFKHSRKVARDNTVKYNWHTLQLLPSSERSTYVGAHVVVQERLDGKLVVCYQNQIVPTQEAPPRPGVLRTLNATRGLGSVTVENLAAGMDTNGIGGHEREGLGAMTAIGRGLAAGRLTTDRESEAVHPKAQPPRPPTPRQRARWKAVQRAKLKRCFIWSKPTPLGSQGRRNKSNFIITASKHWNLYGCLVNADGTLAFRNSISQSPGFRPRSRRATFRKRWLTPTCPLRPRGCHGHCWGRLRQHPGKLR